MKASDYIVEYLIEKGITDVFGYPGGMVTHLMDSLGRYEDRIRSHVTYHEQGAAMAACGYAQASGKTGVAYATSGPGATNLLTGIVNAYMDSIPTVFITGQVNSFEQKGELKVRQRGFQETDIVSMVSSVTKFAIQINDANDLKYYLDKAFYIAQEGRKGPVLLDVAMNVTRTDINPDELKGYIPEQVADKLLNNKQLDEIKNIINESSKPVLLVGKGVNLNGEWIDSINSMEIPVVSSMIAVDARAVFDNYYGFIGAYGDRTANFVVAKSDLVITIGARLDVRQVGAKRENFAPNAELIRIDIDENELEYKVHENEHGYCADANLAINQIVDLLKVKSYSDEWIKVCNVIEEKLKGNDDKEYNLLMRKISKYIPTDSTITTDVGQNQVWVAQSFEAKENQKILFSGGHGAMGYSLPAAIGAYWGTMKPVFSFNGDGGIQMNIQELQTIAREKIPVKVILFNNDALGMIRHFQEMYFDSRFYQTVPSGGFNSPDFEKLADAYGIEYVRAENVDEVEKLKNVLNNNNPSFIEISIKGNTYVFPKLEFGKPNQDQEPLLDRELFNELMELGEK